MGRSLTRWQGQFPRLRILPMLRLTLPPLLAPVLLLGACATPAPTPGSSRDEVLRTWGQPTATYMLPAAGQRLEYATGPWGRTTWMIDLDGSGRVSRALQVLNEGEFLQVQTAHSQPAGMSGEELQRWLGRPAEKRGVWRNGQTWSWRYPTNDCLWFQASIDAAGKVVGSGYSIDPSCDAPSDRD